MEKSEKVEEPLSFWIYGGYVILNMKKYCKYRKLDETVIEGEAMRVEYHFEYLGEKNVFKIKHQIGGKGVLWEEYIGDSCKFKTTPGQEGWEETTKRDIEYQICLEAKDAVLTGYSAQKIWFYSEEFLSKQDSFKTKNRINIYTLNPEEALKDSEALPIGFELKEYNEDPNTSMLKVRTKRVVIDYSSLPQLTLDLKKAITGTNVPIERINDCFYHWSALLVLRNRENRKQEFMGAAYIVVQSVEELFKMYEDMRREIQLISIEEKTLGLKQNVS